MNKMILDLSGLILFVKSTDSDHISVHLIMDYVRDGNIQGQCAFKRQKSDRAYHYLWNSPWSKLLIRPCLVHHHILPGIQKKPTYSSKDLVFSHTGGTRPGGPLATPYFWQNSYINPIPTRGVYSTHPLLSVSPPPHFHLLYTGKIIVGRVLHFHKVLLLTKERKLRHFAILSSVL